MAKQSKAGFILSGDTSGLTSAIDSANDALKNFSSVARNVTKELSSLDDISGSGFKGFADQGLAATSASAEFRKELTALGDALKSKSISGEEYAKAVKSIGDAIQKKSAVLSEGMRLTDQMRTAEEKYSQEIIRLNGLLAEGAISQETFRRATQSARDALSQSSGEAASISAAMKETDAALREGAALTDKMATAEERYATEVERLDKLLGQSAISITTYDRALEAASKSLADASGETQAIADAVRKQADLMREGASVTEKMRTAEEKYVDEVARLNKLLDAGAITQTTFARAVESAELAMRGLEDESGRYATSLADVRDGISSVVSRMNALIALSVARIFASLTRAALDASRALVRMGSDAVSYLTSMVNSASGLTEEVSKSGVIFGRAAADVEAFANSAEGIGLSKTAALQATGQFGALFTAIGRTKEESATMSVAMTKLGVDMASFNNTSVDEALTALQAGLRGETEPLRRFGVLLDDATLRQKALELGIVNTTKQALTPAQKAFAAYNTILAQTAIQQGDVERTAGSLANQQRKLGALVAGTQIIVGQAFEPVYKSLYTAAASMVETIKPFLEKVVAAMEPYLKKLSDVIVAIGPVLNNFIAQWDGAEVGTAIGEGIMRGIDYLAAAADAIIAAIPAAFESAKGIATIMQSAGTVLLQGWDLGRLVIASLKTVIGGVLTAFAWIGEKVFGGILSAIAAVGKQIGYDMSGVDATVAGIRGFRESLQQSTVDAVNDANAAAADMLKRGAEDSGEAIAGPISTVWEQIKAGIGVVGEVAGVAANASADAIERIAVAAGDAARVTVEALDSRSQAGSEYALRWLAGEVNKENPNERRQLAAAEATANATRQMANSMSREETVLTGIA